MNNDLKWNNGKCPYTDEMCNMETCEDCEIENRERRWTQDIDEGEEE